MKRSEALKPLSHEHHHALFVAKVICDQEGAGDSKERFLEFWRSESEQHFRVEEEILLPGSGLPGPDQDEEVARMLSDHLAIRRGAARLAADEASPAKIVELAERLRAHVRFEERELFPRIERELAPEALERLAAQLEPFDC
jgi:hemerythrin-like domain-containing protein